MGKISKCISCEYFFKLFSSCLECKTCCDFNNYKVKKGDHNDTSNSDIR